MKHLTVKARGRHGTSSLDLTLPSKIQKKRISLKEIYSK